MTRAVPEWIGKTPDSKVPLRVRLRIFEANDRRCHLSGRPIRPGDKWELEHKLALSLGGQHRESNMAPALVAPHKEKTRADQKQKSKNYKRALSNAGLKKAKHPIRGWQKFDGTPVRNPKLERRP